MDRGLWERVTRPDGALAAVGAQVDEAAELWGITDRVRKRD